MAAEIIIAGKDFFGDHAVGLPWLEWYAVYRFVSFFREKGDAAGAFCTRGHATAPGVEPVERGEVAGVFAVSPITVMRE